jgi:hypothetical protein
MSWSLLGRGLRLAFYLRVPLLTMLLLAALGPISQWSAAHSLLGNLFDQQTDDLTVGWNIFTVSFAAFLLGFTAVTTLNLTLTYGTERFSDDPRVAAGDGNPGTSFDLRQARPGLTFLCGFVAAIILVGTVIWRTEGSNWWIKIASAAGALACALIATLLAKAVQLALTNPDVTRHPPPYLVFPAYRWPWLQKRFDDLYCWPGKDSQSFLARLLRGAKGGGGRTVQWPLRTVAGAAQGYLSTLDNGCLVLRSGHVFALTLSIMAFVTYFFVGLGKQRIIAGPAVVSGLAYVLLYLLVACWALSALSFFLDRYRFPLLLSIVLFSRLTSSVPESDHFFRIETGKSVKRLGDMSGYLTPAEYLVERAKSGGHDRLIIVATPGGGIQAAAWTAAVLSGLDKKFNGGQNGARTFHDSVGMISSVSGGSLGAMVYATSFVRTISPDDVAKNAERSAIDEVAWGWTGPDFWRTIVPWFRHNLAIDRGWALEQKWAVVNGLSPGPKSMWKDPDPNQDTYISDWAKLGPKIPALVLNSTLVENGRHVVFSTTNFPVKNDPRGIVNFYDLYPQQAKNFDVRINTAARLSASFPYVAPAARPMGLDNLYSPDFHYVDGGYYDNLGVDSVIGWLTEAYSGNSSPRPPYDNILLLQIRHFNAAALTRGSRDGWGFQLLAPPLGLLNMWSNAPTYRDRNELDEFTRARSAQGPNIQLVTIPYCGMDYKDKTPQAAQTDFEKCVKAADERQTGFNFSETPRSAAALKTDCASQPLSWKLSQSQRDCVAKTWEDFERGDPNHAIETIREFLASK